jgi:hypothetical protein
MKVETLFISLVIFASAALGGCTSMSVLPRTARAGDSILVPIGRAKNVTRQNMTVTITPATGSAIKYAPEHPAIRAVINLYPDPVSRLIVGTETGQGLGTNSSDYGTTINRQITNQDKDWWQTLVYLDLPPTLAPGLAAINISGPEGSATSEGTMVEIVAGKGSPANLFDGSAINSQENAQMLRSLERAEHRIVAFQGSVVPHSIQVDMSHSAEIGKPWIVNPRGDIKNVVWSDTGSSLRVLLTPTHGETLQNIAEFKFYVAGGLANLQITGLKAYDVGGRPVKGIVADLQ